MNIGDGFGMGDKVVDIVSGLVGIAVARVEYLNGCIQWCVAPKGQPDALKVDSYYIDEGQLKRIDRGINKPAPRLRVTRRSGGPQKTPAGSRHP